MRFSGCFSGLFAPNISASVLLSTNILFIALCLTQDYPRNRRAFIELATIRKLLERLLGLVWLTIKTELLKRGSMFSLTWKGPSVRPE